MSLFFAILFLFLPCFFQVPVLKELEFLSIHVLTDYPQSFDLSGITNIEGDYWVVDDKEWNDNTYKIALGAGNFYFVDSVSLGIDYKSDIEGIDYCAELGIFFTDEEYDRIYLSTGSANSEMVFNKGQLPNQRWTKNKGLEGVAVDCQNRILYLAKEREPRFIVKYDIENEQVIDIITLPDEEGDISDLKVENGFLYILERNENYITKMDLNTNQIVDRVSYKNTCSHPDGKLYYNSQYGMGEALLLTPEEIWIGLDNNGLPFSEHAQKSYGLSGNQPVLIRFKRPSGF